MGYIVNERVGGVDDRVCGGYSTRGGLVCDIYAPLDAVCNAPGDGPKILLCAICGLDDESEGAANDELEEAEIETLVGVDQEGDNALDAGEDKSECGFGGKKGVVDGVVDFIVRS